jgi:uncharacterized protein (TIGR02246 family)
MPDENASTRDRDARAVIRSVVETWHRATSAGEIARVLPLMAEDAVFLAPGREPMRGREAFEQALATLLETHTIASSGAVREVEVSGDLAYAWTDLTVTVSPRDGQPPSRRIGPTLSVFRKQADGGWLLVRDANMLAASTAELELKVNNLERELMADGPGG